MWAGTVKNKLGQGPRPKVGFRFGSREAQILFQSTVFIFLAFECIIRTKNQLNKNENHVRHIIIIIIIINLFYVGKT